MIRRFLARLDAALAFIHDGPVESAQAPQWLGHRHHAWFRSPWGGE